MKDKKEYEKEIDEIIKVIHWLDSYRKFRVADPTKMERSIEEVCPPHIVKRWKKVEKKIREMDNALRESPLRRLLTIASILRFVSISCLMGIFMGFMAVMLLKVRIPLSYAAIMAIVVIGVVVIPNFYLYFDRYLRQRIQMYYERLEDRFQYRMKKVKNLAQEMIYHLDQLVEKSRLDPKKVRFKLYHIDYDAIEVTSKPGWFSRLIHPHSLYKVMPSIGKTSKE